MPCELWSLQERQRKFCLQCVLGQREMFVACGLYGCEEMEEQIPQPELSWQKNSLEAI